MTKKERDIRKSSKKNFVRAALRRGIPKSEAEMFFDEQVIREEFEAAQEEMPMWTPPELKVVG